ncbi:unnamed protein product, partial [Iphiclides podalirius]
MINTRCGKESTRVREIEIETPRIQSKFKRSVPITEPRQKADSSARHVALTTDHMCLYYTHGALRPRILTDVRYRATERDDGGTGVRKGRS